MNAPYGWRFGQAKQTLFYILMSKKRKSRRNPRKLERLEKKIRQSVIQYLSKSPNRSFNHKQIAAGIDIRGQVSHDHLISLLTELAEAEKIIDLGRGKFQAKMINKIVVGTLDITKDGYGFLIPEEEERDDIFISPRNLGKAFHGDKVKAKIIKFRGSHGRPEGAVLEILERKQTIFIGRITTMDDVRFFQPDNPRITQEFMLQGDTAQADPGDKVLVEMDHFDNHMPLGHITEVLGPAGEHETEIHAILFQYGFQTSFPPEVEEEVARIPEKIPAKEIKTRRDLRGTTTITIDPHDAKDFDDALSFKDLGNDRFEIGVHIADVSYYVRPNTHLDREAEHRATSVYLVDRTVPMLPERLSNKLCSLRPHEDKLTYSAIFEVDIKGEIHKEWFGRTVIHSDHRFTYMEAQAVIEAGEGEYAEELRVMNTIAKIFQKDRFKKGSINFEEDEVKFELDEKGHPIRVYRKVRKDAHKMIEDWMLLANRRVSEHVTKMREHPPLPSIYRVHDRPDQEKLVTLRNFVATLGYELDLENDEGVSGSLNSLMGNVIGKPEQGMVQQIAVRTMAKAVYTTENIGHYGLGFQYYSHFTSPIRRYPDLLFHRLLAQYQSGDLSGNPGSIEPIAKHCSNREKKATEAERASVKYKQVEFLEDKVGQEFEGLVSGVTSWGIYVELIENRCEGMIGLHDMEGDYYEVDQDHYCVRGRTTGDVIRLGDRVAIEVKGTSLRNRNIDFTLLEVIEKAVDASLEKDMPPLAKKGRSDKPNSRKPRSQKPRGKAKYGTKKNSRGSKKSKKSKSKHKRK